MKKRTAQPLVIGVWDIRDEVFTPLVEQPDKPITSIVEMNTWAQKQNMEVGKYELIRRLPGKMIVSEQLLFNFSKE